MATEIAVGVERFAGSLEDGAVVLDVGCGTRPYEPMFSRGVYVGIDVEQSGREADGKLPDTFFDGISIDFPDDEFDAVMCTEVLEHCVDPTTLLSEMNRVLRPGGTLLITVPFMWGIHEAPYDFRRFSTYGLRNAVEGAGFRVTKLARLSQGIEAIRMLVASEINNFNVNIEPTLTSRGGGSRVARWLEPRVWRLQSALWRRLYRFDRIYIDNLVEAVKDPT